MCHSVLNVLAYAHGCNADLLCLVQILVIEGLHPFFDDRVADLCDFKIYLDISDEVTSLQILKPCACYPRHANLLCMHFMTLLCHDIEKG